MDNKDLAALAGFSYLLWTGYGLVGRLGGSAEGHTVAVSYDNPNARATLRGGIEHLNFDSGADFRSLHGSSGSGMRNSALMDFLARNNINTGSYKEMESSFFRLAASLDPFQARADLADAQRTGQAPEVVSHYQYLAELAEAFQQGRLPELMRKWFGPRKHD